MTAMMAQMHAPQATKDGAVGIGIREGEEEEEEVKRVDSSQADTISGSSQAGHLATP